MPPVRYVRTNGIDMAVYEAGKGPAMVLLHGFPELAFSWRHQIAPLAAAGYRVIVPDQRGYGLTERPSKVEDYDMVHLTGDLIGLLDALGVEKAVFAGHDWGGLIAWQMPLFHQNRVAGVIGLNTPFIPHEMLWLQPSLVNGLTAPGKPFVADATKDPITQMREVYSPDMYVLMFEDGDLADRLMARDVARVFRDNMRKGVITAAQYARLPPQARQMAFIKALEQPEPKTLPGSSILTSDELAFYVDSFGRTGFTPGINWYRNLSRNWKAGLNVDQTIKVPSLMIGAEDDVVLAPALMDGMDVHIADLEKHVITGCGHWSQQEKPEEVTALMADWLKRRFPA
ncbi:alpha/beta hydrolase [Mesorhizobium sp. M9A.F.Ca.ET.002.03.1.2]|uniref:alpha/beta fold hydrolase n=1 Tax=Mesorhizobium sp. M9A.F.Ca.ET.002.03.1.2 TaxID=2493668 RepID=UPI001AECB52D|nr:alpha/beta hydrolase [Mesorhizobium sp. M9A.F.Ca.ET.002.03.1.2]